MTRTLDRTIQVLTAQERIALELGVSPHTAQVIRQYAQCVDECGGLICISSSFHIQGVYNNYGIPVSTTSDFYSGHRIIIRSSQLSTTGVTKALVCAILSVGWCI